MQVGPGADNLKHDQTDALGNGYPRHYGNLIPGGARRDSFDLQYGTWFGTGAPLEPLWRTGRYGMGTVGTTQKGQHGNRDHYWYLDPGQGYSSGQLNQRGANQPTAVTVERLKSAIPNASYSFAGGNMDAAHDPAMDAQLWNVELVRLARNPWLLDSIIFYTGHGAYGTGRVATRAYRMDYGLEQVPLVENTNPGGEPALVGPSPRYRRDGQDTLFRNMFQLVAVRRLNVDSTGAISTPATPAITRFAYMKDERATVTVQEALLVQSVWNELGGKTTYVYDFSGIRTDKVNENPLGLSQDQSADLIGRGAVTEQRVPVSQKVVEGENGPLVTDYQYSQPVKLYRGYAIDPHFGGGWNTFPVANRVWGYGQATVLEPSLGGQGRARTEHTFSTSTGGHGDTLLFGRLAERRHFDAAGALLTVEQTRYRAHLAYKNGQAFAPPLLGLPLGHQIETPSNPVWSYEPAFLWGTPSDRYMDAWFVRLDSQSVTQRDPENGNSLTQATTYTHYDWDSQRTDLDGDYHEMYRPVMPGFNPLSQEPWHTSSGFAYPQEPSWMVAAVRESSSGRPHASTERRFYYLWDIVPFVTGFPQDVERHEGSHRPYHLAKKYGIRDALYEERVTVWDGNPAHKPVSLSTWYEHDVFRDVPGDFVWRMDSANYGRVCAPGGGGPLETGRQALVYCTGEARQAEAERAVVETLDDPRLVQDQAGTWWTLPVVAWAALSLPDYEAMPPGTASAPVTGCAGGFVAGPDGGIKYFGDFALPGGGSLAASSLQVAERNYGKETGPDTLTQESHQKVSLTAFLPHAHDGVACDSVHGFASDMELTDTLRSDSLPESSGQRKNFIDMLADQFFLRAVYVQADTVANHYLTPDSLNHNAYLSPHNIWDTLDTGIPWHVTPYRFVFRPAYPAICTRRIHQRNMHGLVLDESDTRHLHTLYEFGKGEYRFWFDECGRPHSALMRQDWGLPASVTLTDHGTVEQVTKYSYLPNGALRSSVAPNGEALRHTYDGRGRPLETFLNGQRLTAAQYAQWKGDTLASWSQRTGQNMVELRTYMDGQGYAVSRSYADPLGREAQSFMAVQEQGGNWHKRFTGKVDRDAWGRMTAAHLPYHKTGQANLNHDPAIPAMPAAETRYESSGLSRPMRASKPGNAVGGSRTDRSSYHIIAVSQYQSETGADWQDVKSQFPSLQVAGQTGGGGSSVNKGSVPDPYADPSNIFLHKTVTTDADGRVAVAYTDSDQRPLATLAHADTGRTEKVVTLFVHDVQGRLCRTLHPGGAETRARHNLQGWPFMEQHPDGGERRTLYNHAGDAVLVQNADMRGRGVFLSRRHDRLGRVWLEAEVTLGRASAGNSWSYVPLHYRDTLGIPFRSIHTIRDELQRVAGEENHSLSAFTHDYVDRSFPPLDFPELSALPLSEWRYDHAIDSSVNSPSVPALPAGILETRAWYRATSDPARVNGRLAMELHRDPQGRLVEIVLHGYRADGQQGWLIRQSRMDGITSGDKGDAHLVANDSYTLTGLPLRTSIDLRCDGRVDMVYENSYDGWGRLEGVAAGHGAGRAEVVRYAYDDATGKPVRQVNLVGGGCTPVALPVDTLAFSHDVQGRFTGLASRYLDFRLSYDGNSPNAGGGGFAALSGSAAVRHGQEWGGGVNGWRARYKLPSAEVPAALGWGGGTAYGFTHDGLGRMAGADASVLSGQFGMGSGYGAMPFGTAVTQTRPEFYGDEAVTYDVAGNITGLSRFLWFAPGQAPAGSLGDSWEYGYAPGGNRLVRLRTAGQPDAAFTYDANGSLLSDSRRGLAVVAMARNGLPVAVQLAGGGTAEYAYGGGGRMWKRTVVQGVVDTEYGLRGADGTVLAYHRVEGSVWAYQISGLGLVAEIGLPDPGPDTSVTHNPNRVRQDKPVRKGTPVLRAALAAAKAIGVGAVTALLDLWQEGRVREGRIKIPVAPVAVAVAAAVDVPKAGRGGGSNARTSQDSAAWPEVKFFVKDHLGNVRVTYRAWVEDSTCAVMREVAAAMDYGPHGTLLRSWFAAGPERIQTTQHERDAGTGWDFRGARLYDAAYGRFTSVDPLAGRFPGWTPYGYAFGRPERLNDPDGMAPGGGDGPFSLENLKRAGSGYRGLTAGELRDRADNYRKMDAWKRNVVAGNALENAYAEWLGESRNYANYANGVRGPRVRPDFVRSVIYDPQNAIPKKGILNMDYYKIPEGAFIEVKGTDRCLIGKTDFNRQLWAEIDALGRTRSRTGLAVPGSRTEFSKTYTLVLPYSTEEVDQDLINEATNRGIIFFVSYAFVNERTGGVVFSAPKALNRPPGAVGDMQGWLHRDPAGIQLDWGRAIPNWHESNETENEKYRYER